jgi:hypothetical protein
LCGTDSRKEEDGKRKRMDITVNVELSHDDYYNAI